MYLRSSKLFRHLSPGRKGILAAKRYLSSLETQGLPSIVGEYKQWSRQTQRILKNILYFEASIDHMKGKQLAALILSLALGIATMYIVWLYARPSSERAPAEKINLALRKTAHTMLSLAGDTIARVPPVQVTGDRSFTVQLEKALNYDTLPVVLHAALQRYGIQHHYDVAVMDCISQELALGYHYLDYTKDRNVPCGGRTMEDKCYLLKVTFDQEPGRTSFPAAGWLLGGLLGFIVFGAQQAWPGAVPVENSRGGAIADQLSFGACQLDPSNQILWCSGQKFTLTYRESKLLALFARHPNQVLERAVILEKVWADEGILVGRSIDMFVSRLRKYLKNDASIRLTTVHGVGYKLEVSAG